MKNKPDLSRRERPALCRAALELELLSTRLLAHLREPKVTKIHRATERTSLALELAATIDHRRDSNLRRVLVEMATALLFVRVLHLQGKISPRVCDHLRRRIDQIVAGVEQMITTHPDRWLALELPPLEAEPSDPAESPERVLSERILKRIDEVAQSLVTVQPAAPDPSESAEPI